MPDDPNGVVVIQPAAKGFKEIFFSFELAKAQKRLFLEFKMKGLNAGGSFSMHGKLMVFVFE